jgi:hypothetical protein
MKYLFLFFWGVSLLFSSCYCECCQCEGAIGDLDVRVLDMDNKPLKGILVSQKSYSSALNAFITDDKGSIITRLTWSPDSRTDWSWAATDSFGYKAVNYLESPYSYTPEHKQITIIDTIRMDVLTPITLRFKSNKADVKNLYINVSKDDSQPYLKVSKPQKRDFYAKTFQFTSLSPIDTTIQVNVFSKAAFTISSSLFGTNPQGNIYRSKTINNYARRDTVFLFEF